jgi:biopolymer transport protein ExbB
MNIKNILISPIILCTALLSFNAFAEQEPSNTQKATSLEALLEQVKSQQFIERKNHTSRESEFLSNKKTAAKMLSDAQATYEKTQEETRKLKSLYSKNEKTIAKTQETLRLSTGNLGELFGVVRQVSADSANIIQNSLTNIDNPERESQLNLLATSKVLPSVDDLRGLWLALQNEMTASAQIKQFESTFVNTQGLQVIESITRIGNFVVFNKDGYLEFDAQQQRLIALPIQPSDSGDLTEFWEQGDQSIEVLIDPSRGTLMSLLKQSPDLLTRIDQGGLIGYIILCLGLMGVGLAAWRFVFLSRVTSLVNHQLVAPHSPIENNPLGRVLNIYMKNKNALSIEHLENRVDEAILKELPALEKGNGFIKLLAGIAPLLGLLGTVTGMIATFQAITLFGSGDPKLMAEGISSALITTVLGLVVAIPLLFLYTLIHSKSRHIIQILDQQSSGLIAQAIEANEDKAILAQRS